VRLRSRPTTSPSRTSEHAPGTQQTSKASTTTLTLACPSSVRVSDGNESPVLSHTNRCTSIHGLEDVLRSAFPSHTPQLRTAVPARPTQAARPPTRRDNSEVDHEDESAPIAYRVGRIRDPLPRSSSCAAAGASRARSPVRYISARALRVVPHAHGSRGMHLPSMHDERSCVCARRRRAPETTHSSPSLNCSSSAPCSYPRPRLPDLGSSHQRADPPGGDM
jgi:hypothetical protein